MRLLTIIVVLLALGWTGYWFVGANALETAIRDALEEARAEGVEVETAALDVTGFPNRFDTMIEAPQVHFPASGITWSAPFLQIFALSYRPNQLIVALPETQDLTGPFGSATIDAETARASATVEPSMDLTLDHANLVVENLAITSAGIDLTAARLLAATRVPEGAEDARVQNIGITFDDISLPSTMRERLGGAGMIDGATLDATVTLAEPITRATYQGAGIEVETIQLDRFDVDWGDVQLKVSGNLEVGAGGLLHGELTTMIVNWPRALELASAAGLLPPEQASQVRRGLALLSGMSGGDSRIELPLSFRDGKVFLGPIPLGTAPRL